MGWDPEGEIERESKKPSMQGGEHFIIDATEGDPQSEGVRLARVLAEKLKDPKFRGGFESGVRREMVRHGSGSAEERMFEINRLVKDFTEGMVPKPGEEQAQAAKPTETS